MIRNIVDIINQILDVIPKNRISYELIQDLTKIRDRASFMPPEIILVAWIELHAKILETLKPEEFQLTDWELQVMNILTDMTS